MPDKAGNYQDYQKITKTTKNYQDYQIITLFTETLFISPFTVCLLGIFCIAAD